MPAFNIGFGLHELASMALAVVFGAMVGFERELHGKAAGLRTNMLICLGAAVFTIIAREISSPGSEEVLSRMTAGIVTGVGFLGAGAIIRDRAGVAGLTTAAGIWVVAAIGIACGSGMYMTAFMAVLFTLIVLWVLHPLEAVMRKKQKDQQYRGGDSQ